MNTTKQIQGPKNCFHHKGIDPGPHLEKDANLKLVQLLAMAPPGAYSTWSIEKTGKNYLAEVKMFSPFRSFSSRSEGMSPHSVVHRALERMEDQLYRWRWGGNKKDENTDSKASDVGNLPYARSG